MLSIDVLSVIIMNVVMLSNNVLSVIIMNVSF
jgi:hypothetical protein